MVKITCATRQNSLQSLYFPVVPLLLTDSGRFPVFEEVFAMSRDTIKGTLRQIQADISRKWSRVTNDVFFRPQENLDILVGRNQHRSSERREKIEQWFRSQGLG